MHRTALFTALLLTGLLFSLALLYTSSAPSIDAQQKLGLERPSRQAPMYGRAVYTAEDDGNFYYTENSRK